ncbi:uncharacterized protein LOC123419943 [Hordeum vulgare subsp. vulgare]|uniref:uncharacterized protein LOC123419943 n=1 Tax=Hordeum vulgare subsp. vulgare TaxID=112509 RepID=UPI00162C6D6B|nr:uncharacterized protein LOC123419943 [Hordeum vulgare subsp. vulgare]
MRQEKAATLATTAQVLFCLICTVPPFVSTAGVWRTRASFEMDQPGNQPWLGGADGAVVNPDVVLPVAYGDGGMNWVLSAGRAANDPLLPNVDVHVAPFFLPSLEHQHPHPADVLAWAYERAPPPPRIHADPLMQRLEAIGALQEVELMIIPPFPRSEIMAVTVQDELADVNAAPFFLPALDHPYGPHPHPGDVLAWVYGQGPRIQEDPVMERLEAIGALQEVELMIVPAFPGSGIMAVNELAPMHLPPIDAVPGAPEEIEVELLDGDVPPPSQSP